MYTPWIAASAAVLFAAAGPALAQDNTNGLYVGVGLGEFSTEIDEISDIDDVDLDFDTDEDAWKVFGGYRINRFLAVQLDYYDFGDSSVAVGTLPLTAETDGTAASVVGTLPIGPVELFARVGRIWYDVSVDFDGDTVVDESGNDNIFSAGVGFTVLQRLNLKVEYEEIELDNAIDDASAVWLSASWRF
jgi:hypothetical protein